MRNKIAFFLCFGLAAMAWGQTAEQAWLRYGHVAGGGAMPLRVRALGNGLLERSAVQEIDRAITAYYPGISRSGEGLTARAKEQLGGETVLGTVAEMRRAYPDVPIPRDLKPEGYWLYFKRDPENSLFLIAGADEPGVLRGAFALLQYPYRPDTFDPRSHSFRSEPAMPIRWVNEWDNADGTIERGYGGR